VRISPPIYNHIRIQYCAPKHGSIAYDVCFVFYRSSESDEDWKAKYEEVCEMLAETEAELKEFQISSKELEDEMALDVERAEKAREDMENKLSRMEGERDDWKVCPMHSAVLLTCCDVYHRCCAM